jgi:hypothetical protein
LNERNCQLCHVPTAPGRKTTARAPPPHREGENATFSAKRTARVRFKETTSPDDTDKLLEALRAAVAKS